MIHFVQFTVYEAWEKGQLVASADVRANRITARVPAYTGKVVYAGMTVGQYALEAVERERHLRLFQDAINKELYPDKEPHEKTNPEG